MAWFPIVTFKILVLPQYIELMTRKTIFYVATNRNHNVKQSHTILIVYHHLSIFSYVFKIGN